MLGKPRFSYEMRIKIHKAYRDVVAICDSELIGKKFEQGKFQLDIKENFFNGQEFNKEEALKLMKDLSKEDVTFNIIGKESTETALKAEIIKKQGIKEIQGIPFALILI